MAMERRYAATVPSGQTYREIEIEDWTATAQPATGTAAMTYGATCRARSKRYEGSGVRPAKGPLPLHGPHPRTLPGEAVLSTLPRSLKLILIPLRRSQESDSSQRLRRRAR